MLDGDAGRGIAAEEELEQEFVAGRVVAYGMASHDWRRAWPAGVREYS